MAKKAEPAEKRYTKAQILQSRRYNARQRDVLDALLQDGVSYTKDEVKKIHSDFLKKEAK
ncbi:hypothetical protein Desde_1089 [Desulfitobacterium dehalogenans ATCC 51507]|uniref:Uncharacterized protein n=1 Tax=Desulfitobacterium dehalogenans (strain ATCC 51507 / DSM 9161 / JW/IU-DC1) TaxID=756499 RepID=I4A6D7_DESDJ|nr:hypothetical protein [Desulfitobacterium dehalogenans]AFL99521.1 hypothetical protein Desde_1089 [Desulfitobacterium dehalogenans ATCC 51507]